MISGSLVLLIALVFLAVKDWGECSFTEEYAMERLLKEMVRANLDPEYLGEPSFSNEDCSYSFLYEGGGRKISYLFTGWGEIHRWDYASGENGP